MSSFSPGRLASRAAEPAAGFSHSPSHSAPHPGAFNPAAFQLHGVQWHLPDGRPLWQEPLHLMIGRERLALVGRNGVGKTVLAQLLAGQVPPAGSLSGQVLRPVRVHLVAAPMLPQDRRTVGEAMGLGPLFEATRRLADGQASPDDLQRIEGHWDLHARAAQALADAGLAGLRPSARVAGLSGGERMRVALAGAMTTDAQAIVLDEPSNHLDATARTWLTDWLLAATERTVVLVSHDRQLLRCVDRTAELSPRGLAVYGGDYALYRQQRDGDAAAAEAALQRARHQRDSTLARLQREQQARQRRQTRGHRWARTANLPGMFLNGLRETAEATAARDRQRAGAKRQALDEAVRAAAERVEQPPAVVLPLPASRVAADKPVLALQSLRLPHVDEKGTHPLIDITLAGPARVAVIGPNGCGKSTLLRVIAGTLAPRQGSATTAVPTATLDQHGGDALPPDRSLLDHLRALDCPLPTSELRTRLAQLRLDAARVQIPLGLLSAGERLKAALACALWRKEPAKLLLLDEPTNHLDLDTTLVLQRALQGFEGALIVASHDTEFIEALRPTHRWEWRDGRLVMRQASMGRVEWEASRGVGREWSHR